MHKIRRPAGRGVARVVLGVCLCARERDSAREGKTMIGCGARTKDNFNYNAAVEAATIKYSHSGFSATKT